MSKKLYNLERLSAQLSKNLSINANRIKEVRPIKNLRGLLISVCMLPALFVLIFVVPGTAHIRDGAIQLPAGGSSSRAILHVPDDYPTIQQAVDNANPGDTIRVAAGLYSEYVTVSKPLTLIGEDRETTLFHCLDMADLGR